MTASPPGARPVVSPRRSHVGEKGTSVGHAVIKQMTAALRAQPEMQGVTANRLNRMVRARIALQDRERRSCAYADPTGETAVRNVLRGTG